MGFCNPWRNAGCEVLSVLQRFLAMLPVEDGIAVDSLGMGIEVELTRAGVVVRDGVSRREKQTRATVSHGWNQALLFGRASCTGILWVKSG